MVETRRNPMNRGKQPVVAVPDDEETPEHETDVQEPKTPMRSVETDEHDDDEDEDNIGEGSSSLRERLLNTPSKERFQELARQYKLLEQKCQELKDEVTVLLAERVDFDDVIKNLQIERDEAIAHRDLAIKDRGDLAFQLLNRNYSSGAPNVEAIANRKTTKMPDAPMLSDGKEVRFETWETVMRQKLEANADHYPLPVHRKLYVQSRCEGKAQLHIAPRMSSDSSNPYVDAEDMITHLKTVFANPNRRAEAYTTYHKLMMKPKDSFTDFLAEFMQLAEEAVVIEENRKRDLYSKLPYLLQSQVMWAVNQDIVTFESFTKTCQSMSHEINLQQEAKTTSCARSTVTTGSGAGAGITPKPTSTSVYTPRVKREESANPGRLSNAERDILMKEGRCFNCKEQGYMTRDCPKKKPAGTVAVAAARPSPRIIELDDDEDDSQGKADA